MADGTRQAIRYEGTYLSHEHSQCTLNSIARTVGKESQQLKKAVYRRLPGIYALAPSASPVPVRLSAAADSSTAGSPPRLNRFGSSARLSFEPPAGFNFASQFLHDFIPPRLPVASAASLH